MNKELLNLNANISKLSDNTREFERLQNNLSEKIRLLKNRLDLSHQEIAHIISLIPDGVLLINRSYQVTMYNMAAKLLIGIPLEAEIKDRLFSEFFKDDLLGFSITEELLNPGPPKTFVLSFSDSSEIKNLEVFVRSYENGLFILIRDRSSYAQLERSLEKYKSISELGQMVATLAHEIRNPLGGIEGFAGLLNAEIENPRHKKMVQSILDGSRCLNNLVSSMLNYTHIPSLKLYPVNISSFIKHLLPSFEVFFSHDHPISFQSENDSSMKSIDKDRMQTVIWNIVTNAVDASPSGSSIILKITEAGDIVITNQGKKIPEDQISRLFVPFFTTKSKGNGLGLAEALKVVRMHGGNIIVRSNHEKTSFIIELPG